MEEWNGGLVAMLWAYGLVGSSQGLVVHAAHCLDQAVDHHVTAISSLPMLSAIVLYTPA